jgi:hypothetical protein
MNRAVANAPLELVKLDLVETWSKADESERARFTWAVTPTQGRRRARLRTWSPRPAARFRAISTAAAK